MAAESTSFPLNWRELHYADRSVELLFEGLCPARH